jgi:hypothetical protein
MGSVQRKEAKGQPVLLATFAFYLATQLMPGAHQQPLLVAMQEKAQGEPCKGATGTRATAASSICSCRRQQEGQNSIAIAQRKHTEAEEGLMPNKKCLHSQKQRSYNFFLFFFRHKQR